MERVIVRQGDRLFRHLLSLRKREYREAVGRTLVDGGKLARELLRDRYPAVRLILREDVPDWETDLEVVRLPRGLFRRLVEREDSDGVALEVRLPERPSRVAVRRWAVAVDGIQNPSNLGAIARTLRALGGEALFLYGPCVDAFHPRALRASGGALLRLPVLRGEPPKPWIASSPHEGTDLRDFSFPTPCVLFLGSEGRGLSEEVRKSAEACVRIPHAGESLSVVAAAAILFWELARQQNTIPSDA